jgi:hypothetical protein
MAENIERAAQNQISSAAGASRGHNSVLAGILTGKYFADNRPSNRSGRNGEPSQAHWENMDAYANREHARRLDYLGKSHELSPEGTFASGVEYGDRGVKNAYTQRRAEAAAKAEAKPAATRSRQTAKTPPKPSTGSKSRGAEVGAAIGGTIGTALGAAAVKNPAGAAVGGEVGAKLGEAAGSAVSNALANSKAKKAGGPKAGAQPVASAPTPPAPSAPRAPRKPTSPGYQEVTRQSDGTWK